MPIERLALEYAEAMTQTPPVVDDALFERLRAAFSPAAIVELTAGIALQNLSARCNAALGAQAHGFCTIAVTRRKTGVATQEVSIPSPMRQA